MNAPPLLMNTPLIFPATVLDQHLVVLGKTGSGKSSAMRYMVEYLLTQKKRVCIVDPKGDWHGIKIAADGKHPGFPVIAFGNFKDERATDVPINAQSGKQVAELIATGNRPCVIGFRGWMQGEMTRFWIDFASIVFKLNKGDLYLVIDEVHNFAPKGKIPDPEIGKCLHWTNRIMNEGRGLGITALIASQRPQKVHNDTLTACETLVAMRVIHEADRAALKEWIDGCGDKAQGKIVLDNVAQMPRGDAYMWSPEIGFGPTRIHVPMFKTFDSFAPPQLQKAISESGWGDVDIEDVKAKLAVVIEESKANDPCELKKTIAELRKHIAAKEPMVETKEVRVEVPVLREGQLKRVEALAERMAKTLGVLKEAFERGMEAYNGVMATVERVHAQGHAHAHAKQVLSVHKPAAMGPSFLSSPSVRKTPEGTPPPTSLQRAVGGEILRMTDREKNGERNGDALDGPSRRILNALAELEVLNIHSADRVQVALFAGYSNLASKGFANAIGALRTNGDIEYPRAGEIALTASGRAKAAYPDAPASNREVHDRVKRIIASDAFNRILDVLLACYPHAIAREELAAQSGYSNVASKGFANSIGRLRTLGLIDYPERGMVQATQILFPH